MAQCERLNGCPFFKKIQCLPRTVEQLVATYCQGDNTGCARLWVVSAELRPPEDLFPNERDRALRILSDAGKPLKAALEKMPPKTSPGEF